MKRSLLALGMVMALVCPASAHADVLGTASHLVNQFGDLFDFTPTKSAPHPSLLQNYAAPTLAAPALTPKPLTQASLSHVPSATVPPPPPSVKKGAQRFSCVAYARMISDMEIFGDARLWWRRARGLYARVSQPVEDAVMVFSGSRRLRHGHLAVVTRIVSPREVIVDQANWLNRGEIDLDTPILDVSKNNDWSRVRVWNIHTEQYGTHVYSISGFVAKEPAQQGASS